MPVTQLYKLETAFTLPELASIRFSLEVRITALKDHASRMGTLGNDHLTAVDKLIAVTETAAGKIANEITRITGRAA